jgi:hypothetical protein
MEAYLEFTVSFSLQIRSDQAWVAYLIGLVIFIMIPGLILMTAR